MSRQEWLKGLFQSIDAMDAEKFGGHLAENGSFKLGNAAAVTGRSSIKEAVGGFFSTIEGLKHTVSESFENGNTLTCRGEVTYTKKDKSEVTVPFANFFVMEGDLAVDYQVYIDISPLFS